MPCIQRSKCNLVIVWCIAHCTHLLCPALYTPLLASSSITPFFFFFILPLFHLPVTVYPCYETCPKQLCLPLFPLSLYLRLWDTATPEDRLPLAPLPDNIPFFRRPYLHFVRLTVLAGEAARRVITLVLLFEPAPDARWVIIPTLCSLRRRRVYVYVTSPVAASYVTACGVTSPGGASEVCGRAGRVNSQFRAPAGKFGIRARRLWVPAVRMSLNHVQSVEFCIWPASNQLV